MKGKPILITSRAANPDRCQAVVLSDLLTNTSLRLLLPEYARMDGRLGEWVIAAAHVSNPEHGAYEVPQCTRRPVDRRNGYPVCGVHKRARYFLPWTPAAGMTPRDAFRHHADLINAHCARAEERYVLEIAD